MDRFIDGGCVEFWEKRLALKSSLDRFIVALLLLNNRLETPLKSSLDRFIADTSNESQNDSSALKSSLDRFIVFRPSSSSVRLGFKIQFG